MILISFESFPIGEYSGCRETCLYSDQQLHTELEQFTLSRSLCAMATQCSKFEVTDAELQFSVYY